MKSAITLQISGVVFASAGLALRVSGLRMENLAKDQLNAGGGLTAILRETEGSLQHNAMVGANIESTGVGLLTLGCGLLVIGILLLVVKRRDR